VPDAVSATCTPKQVVGELTLIVGCGFTVIIYDESGPTQPFSVGIIVIVPEIAVVPALAAVNEGIFPVPLAASPMAAFELDHV
jgi:hypothetical protein